MANKSYLYSFNKNNKEKISKTFDISEQNYEIPIVYQILVSKDTQIVNSKIFDDTHAIVGKAKEGRKRLDAFFVKLFKKNIFEKKELKGLQKMFIEHLDKYTLDYFLFEPAEIISMDDVDVNKEINNIKNKIADYDTLINDFFESTDSDNWAKLGIDACTFLEMSLGDEKEVAKIEAVQDNKKVVEIKKKLEKKPTAKLYLQLTRELDDDKDADKIDAIIDKAVALNPSSEILFNCAINYLDLDKKIALFNNLLLKNPENPKLYYWLASAYEDKENWKMTLTYIIKDIECSKDPFKNIGTLERIIKKGQFDKQEVFEKISKKVRIKKIEAGLVKCLIEKGEYQKAFDMYYKVYDFIKDKEEDHWRQHQSHSLYIARSFIDKDQTEKGLEIAIHDKQYYLVKDYFNEINEFGKALYWAVKDIEHGQNGLYWHIASLLMEYKDDGKYASKDIDVPKLFESFYSKINDFKPKTIVKLAKQLRTKYAKDLDISIKLLEKIIPITKNNIVLAKANFQLGKIHQQKDNLEKALIYYKTAFSLNEIKKYQSKINKLKPSKGTGFLGRLLKD